MSSKYYVKEEIIGYKKGSIPELAKELDNLGYKYHVPQMGGGGDGTTAILEQVIAWISYHDFWFGIFTGIAANRLDKLLSKIHLWSKKNKSDNKYKSVVSIFIKDRKKEYHSIEFDADKKYTKKEIKILLEKLAKDKQHLG